MAICHFDVKAVSRATGRSAVAAAAYRTGETLTNDRDGVTHDYAKRTGVDGKFVVVPSGCEWAADRSKLWNAAEAAERRKDAKVAREYVVAIPHELDAPAREALVRGFAESIVERFGVAADVALHAPGKDGDQRNHHAHILTTTRVVEPDGLGAKTRQLDVASTAAAEVSSLRELWAMQCNEALEKNHQKARVEPRSYAAQGIDRVPGVHLGPEATAIERREQKAQGQNYKPRTFKAKQNAAAAERNAVIDAAKKLIDAAEQAITRATSAAKEVVDWFSSLAQSVGSATIEKEQKERAEKEARERQKAQERAKEQEEYRKRLQEIAQRREQDRGRGRGR